MQEDAAAGNTEKLAALSALAKLDRQTYEVQGTMAELLAALDSSFSTELKALGARKSMLKVCAQLITCLQRDMTHSTHTAALLSLCAIILNMTSMVP